MLIESPDLWFLLKLLVAGMLGIVIGIERQWHQGLAGMRTNAMVATAAAAFVALPTLQPEDGTGPAHMANYIVTGIGFLGGGVILREGTSIRGLNTAATMWATAAAGALTGCGLFVDGVVLALVVLGINVVLRPLVSAVNRLAARFGGGQAKPYLLEFDCAADRAGPMRQKLLRTLDRQHLALRAVQTRDQAAGRTMVSAEVIDFGPDDARIENLVAIIGAEPSVTSARWALQSSADSDPRVHSGS